VDQWFFNNVNTVERKTKDAITARLGGVMVWEVGQDCASYKDGPCSPHNTAHEGIDVATAMFESRSLLAAVGRAVRKQRSVLQAQAAGAETKEEL
jgi:GH18 family chitinase